MTSLAKKSVMTSGSDSALISEYVALIALPSTAYAFLHRPKEKPSGCAATRRLLIHPYRRNLERISRRLTYAAASSAIKPARAPVAAGADSARFNRPCPVVAS